MSYPYHRISRCWSCHAYLNNNIHDECPACGWIICPECGACAQHACFGEAVPSLRERTALRALWVSLPQKPTNIIGWGKTALAEAEDAKYRSRLTPGAKLKSSSYGVGYLKELLVLPDGSKRLVVSFSSGDKRFVYPEALSVGRLTFVD